MPDMAAPCPRCQGNVLLDYEEVDIGVGIQSFLTGGWCENCGAIHNCPTCSGWIFQVEPSFDHDDKACARISAATLLVTKTLLGRGPTRYDLLQFEAEFGDPFDIGVVQA